MRYCNHCNKTLKEQELEYGQFCALCGSPTTHVRNVQIGEPTNIGTAVMFAHPNLFTFEMPGTDYWTILNAATIPNAVKEVEQLTGQRVLNMDRTGEYRYDLRLSVA